VANPVAGLGILRSEFRGSGLKITMVVSVLETILKRLMVYINNRQLGLHSGHADGFKLQKRHRSLGIVEQRLVYVDSHFPARQHFTRGEMLRNNFFD
jgi:hypothetical protein